MDLGCGTGLCGLAFQANAAYLVGVDLSPKMVEQTRARGIYNAVSEGEIGEYLATRFSAFDIAIAADVLIYIGDAAHTFAAVREALASGGWFVFSIEVSEQAGFRGQPTGRFVHHPDYIRELARQTRFTIVAEHHTVLRKELGREVAGMIFIVKAS